MVLSPPRERPGLRMSGCLFVCIPICLMLKEVLSPVNLDTGWIAPIQVQPHKTGCKCSQDKLYLSYRLQT